GNRAQTVAAVRELIPRLRARGFRFVRLGELAGLSPAFVDPPASGFARARGGAFELSVRVAFTMIAVFSVILLAVGVLLAGRVVLLLALASHHRRTTRRRRVGSDYEPS